jgi:hypothetical protein
MNKQRTNNHSQQLSAHRHPCSRVSRAAVIGAAWFLPIYLCVSRTEALLMASNTSYLGVCRVASALSCFIHASFVTYKRLAILVLDLECKGSTLLYSCLVDPICYG